MLSEPSVTAIVVNWNAGDLLGRCLESLQRSELPLEVLLVDNASTDGTTSTVRERFPAVRLIENRENLGFSRANNQALSQSRGRFILLLNPDAELQTGALEALVSRLEARPQAAVVGPRVIDGQGRPQSTRRRFPTLGTEFLESTLLQRFLPLDHPVLRRYYLLDRSDEEAQAVDWLVGACLLVRRAALDQVGPLDERFFMYFEEVDWCQRLRWAGWEILYEPSALVVHHGGRSSEQVPLRRHCLFNESKCRYVAKYHGRAAALALRWFLFATSGIQFAEEAAKLLLGHKPELRRDRVRLWAGALRWQAARLLSV